MQADEEQGRGGGGYERPGGAGGGRRALGAGIRGPALYGQWLS